MNEFDGLLPPRRGTVPLPARGGPAVVVGAARRRRRRRATELAGATTVVVMAVTALATLRPAVDRHGLTATPTATATPSGGATVTPSAPARPSYATSARAAAPPAGSPRPDSAATPGGRPTTSPGAVTPPRPPAPPDTPANSYTPFVRSVVPDRADETCGTMTAAEQPGTSVCMRALAPATTRSGVAVPLVAEICARYGAVTLHFPGDEEGFLWIHDASADQDVYRTRARPTGVGAHTVDIAAATCLRYEFDWRGQDREGRAMSPGDYSVCADAATTWARKFGYAGCTQMRVVER